MRSARVWLLLLLAACSGEAETTTTQDRPSASQRVVVQDRYVVRESRRDFDTTVAALFEALDRRDLTVFAVIDHAAAASAVDLTLPPTMVVIFGDPTGGTPLMKDVPVMGAELPLRALVYERNGEVFVATTGIANLARTYPLADRLALVRRIDRMLNEIASEVAGS